MLQAGLAHNFRLARVVVGQIENAVVRYCRRELVNLLGLGVRLPRQTVVHHRRLNLDLRRKLILLFSARRPLMSVLRLLAQHLLLDLASDLFRIVVLH